MKLCTQCRCKGYGIERVVGLGQDGVEPVTTAWCLGREQHACWHTGWFVNTYRNWTGILKFNLKNFMWKIQNDCETISNSVNMHRSWNKNTTNCLQRHSINKHKNKHTAILTGNKLGREFCKGITLYFWPTYKRSVFWQGL